MIGGRPHKWDGDTLKILHEYTDKSVTITLSSDEWASENLEDDFIKPALRCLDMITYPERHQRILDALRTECIIEALRGK